MMLYIVYCISTQDIWAKLIYLTYEKEEEEEIHDYSKHDSFFLIQNINLMKMGPRRFLLVSLFLIFLLSFYFLFSLSEFESLKSILTMSHLSSLKM